MTLPVLLFSQHLCRAEVHFSSGFAGARQRDNTVYCLLNSAEFYSGIRGREADFDILVLSANSAGENFRLLTAA
jgi:hypothetical protein